jgi:CRP-like cAMP-binding protein
MPHTTLHQSLRGAAMISNGVIDSLSEACRARVLAVCETVTLPGGATLGGNRRASEHRAGCAYFPTGGVLALLASAGDGRELQVAMVGCHGLLNMEPEELLGTAPTRAVVQIGGTALRVRTSTLRRQLGDGATMGRLLREAHAQRALQAVSIAACAHFHTISQRLCRFLLASAACAGDLRLQMTHETMARMLGVRRSGISDEVAHLQRGGLVLCHRGGVDLLSLDALARGACSCQQRDHRCATGGTA